MSREGLTQMAKVEVVVEGADARAVEELFTEVGVSGWTTLPNISGAGHGGYHQGRLAFNDTDAPAMLITVAPDDRVEALVAGLRTLLSERSGVFFVTDTWVSRASYFGEAAPSA